MFQHRRFGRAWVLVAFACFVHQVPLCAQTVSPSKSDTIRETKAGQWLVLATAIAINKAPDNFSVKSTWVVNHVFNGPSEILNKEFAFTYRTGISSGFGYVPLADVKDKAVWLVELNGSDVVPSPGRMEDGPAYGLRLPIVENHPWLVNTGGFAHPEQVKKINLDYPEALKYARTIEKLTSTRPSEQMRLLRNSTKSSISQLSAWSIMTLAQSGERGVNSFLLALVYNSKLSVKGLLALDGAVEGLRGENNTPEAVQQARSSLWKRIVNSSATDEEGILIVNRLLDISRLERRVRIMVGNHGILTVQRAQLAQWLLAASANPKWTKETRAYALKGWEQVK